MADDPARTTPVESRRQAKTERSSKADGGNAEVLLREMESEIEALQSLISEDSKDCGLAEQTGKIRELLESMKVTEDAMFEMYTEGIDVEGELSKLESDNPSSNIHSNKRLEANRKITSSEIKSEQNVKSRSSTKD
eukprot:CAMPEP_0197514906 /NCGR_PEP_ID=MMETSP1318-20131121/202_1 /TAXON_ID=552666 /ORGANISM="Partenskyella glossopodia, Strain RCC365" /LENGTH=135 /DNA_ID=CAMNT_0043063127 /DNA_START=9 /DNA_END=416 /DNA_ORIENTATION=-